MAEETSRREFCVSACGLVSAAAWTGAIGVVLPACGSGGGGTPSGPSGAASLPVVNAQVTGGAIGLTIDGSSPLASVGSAALLQSARGPILVAREAQETFAAVTAVCTHEGCTITGFSNQTYVCPCHGSQFSTSGQVRQGPARQALAAFATRFSNDTLTITL